MKTTFIKESYLNYLSIAVIVGLIINFYYQFFHYTSDIPLNDDYKAILDFLNNFKVTNSFSERLSLLFAQHNEHRIVYDRIWTLICYKIYGVVNFNFLSFIGNLSYLVIFIFICLPFRNKSHICLIPIAILLFNFSFHENITFSMATLSNNTGLLFIILSIYFAVKDDKYQLLSVVFYLFAVFTVGSGLFLTVLLPLIFLYKKQKKMVLFFSIFALLTLLLYFIGYQTPPQSPNIIETLTLFKIKTILFFFAFIGNIFSFNLIFTDDLNDSLMFSSIIGGLMILFYLYSIKKKYYKKNLFVFSIITFILLAAIITSVNRSQFGLETAIASRYRLYSALLIICFYYYFVNSINIKSIYKYIGIVVFSGFYFINISSKHLEYLDYRQNLNYLGAINYLSNNYKQLNGFEQDLYKKTLENSKNSQTYNLPKKEKLDKYYPFSNSIPKLEQTNNTNLWFTQGVEQIFELNDSFLIFGKGFLDGQSSYEQKIYLEVENNVTKQVLAFETFKIKRYDMNPYFKKNNLDYGGFCCRIKKDLLDNQEYIIKLAILNNSLFKKEVTDKKIKKS